MTWKARNSMGNLKAVLQRAADQFLKGGGGVASGVKRALRAHRQQQTTISIVLAILIVAATGWSGWLLLTGATHSRQLAALLGIGTGGGLEALRRVWKDWSQTDLLLILIEDASEIQIATIVKKLTARQ
jgi:hypothetical protein